MDIMKLLGKPIGDRIKARQKAEQKQKVENFKTLNKMAKKGQILFTGSSLMEQFPIVEMANSIELEKKVYNRGIGGTTTEDFLREIDAVLLDLEPSKVFINIGTNDFMPREDGRDWEKVLFGNYKKILEKLKERLPETEVYLMAYYPVNEVVAQKQVFAKRMVEIRTNENLIRVNKKVEKLAENFGYHYIDANEGLADTNGRLKEALTTEGVHMKAKAYEIIFNNLKQYL